MPNWYELCMEKYTGGLYIHRYNLFSLLDCFAVTNTYTASGGKFKVTDDLVSSPNFQKPKNASARYITISKNTDWLYTPNNPPKCLGVFI